ncbi:MAG: hypothetical protein V2A71_06300, partial [Candidatus Eisenbacteria bacterium]
ALALVLFCSVAGSAELPGGFLAGSSADPWSGLVPLSSRSSLLDLSKIDISHQVVFSYSSGSGRGDDVGGLWRTNFRYPLSGALKLDVGLGTSLSKSGAGDLQTNKFFLESFSLSYRPSESFFLHLSYREAPYNHLYLPLSGRPDGK